MKKVVMMLAMAVAIVFSAQAQHYRVNSSDFNQVNVSFSAGEIQSSLVKTANGNFSQLFMEDYLPSRQVGMPELPVMTKLVEIPLCDSVIATVSNARYVEVDASELGVKNDVYPVQPSYPKSYTGQREFAKNTSVYAKDGFYEMPLLSVEKNGVMRDVNIATVTVSPVAYNPVTKKFRICKSMDVTLTFVNADIPGTYEMKAKYGSPLFEAAATAVINPAERSRDEFSATPIKYVIIAHSMFEGNAQLTEFVNWKKRLGYIVDLAFTGSSQVGTTNTSIANYIKSQYTNATPQNPAPTFVLLIGDHQQIPAFSSSEQNSHVTDLYYATFTNDNLPDCYYGRFSATNVSQLTPQIEKTLMYEQYTMTDPSYLGAAVLIAGTDSYWSTTHAQGAINYAADYINTSSQTHQYTSVHKHNYNCSSQASTIRQEVSNGSGWTNYTAHGSEDGWYDPGFNNSHVSSLNNNGKYGVMIGNCCLTGKFNYSSDCFGEVLLRTPNKGAVVYVGASEVSYWNEDYYWAVGNRSNCTANPTYNASNLGTYDRMFHTHNEAHSNWNTTMGGLVQGGNMAVQSSSSDLKLYYWEIYHIFGDPSLKPYLGIPAALTVNSSDVILAGASTYEVQTAPYAYVALTKNNEFVAAAFADGNGNAQVPLNDIVPGEYELAVGAQNHIQFFKTINVVVPSGPYVVAQDVQLSSASSPVNGYMVDFDLVLKNLGVSAANNVTATMTSSTPGVVINQGTAAVSAISADASQTVANAFTASIPQTAKDGDVLEFTVAVNFGSTPSSKTIYVTVTAPNMVVDNYSVQAPNQATSIAPGDAVTVSFVNKNIGHFNMDYAVVDLTSNYSGAVVTTPSYEVYALAPGQSTTNTFVVLVSEDVPDLTIIPLYYHRLMGNQHLVDTIYMTVGNAMETFESGDFTQFNWSNTSNPWVVVNQSPYAGSYCAKSKNNLNNNATSTLQITISSLSDGNITYFRKVSSESGYDKFKFYIDNNQMEEQSGTVAWGQASFPVTAGTHTYKFTYSKDGSMSSGSDCAWIDNVSFPGLGTMAPEDVDGLVGVEEYAAQNHVSVYPNPTRENLFVSSEKAIRDITVIDLSGRVIARQQANGSETNQINVASLVSGVYFVKVVFEDNQVSTSKFIKQ